MTESTFDRILKTIEPPIGKIYESGIYTCTGAEIKENIGDKLKNVLPDNVYTIDTFDKVIVLTDNYGNKEVVVGGILFYGDTDLQIYVIPEYRDNGYMKNVMQHKDLFLGQKGTIEVSAVKDIDDLNKKLYLAELAGIQITNTEDVEWLKSLQVY